MGRYPKVLDLNRLKQDLNLSDETIRGSGFPEDELQKIYEDYIDRMERLEQLKNQFVSEYIVSAKDLHFHSYSGRVKDPYHMIEKLIRKRSTNYKKYKDVEPSNYYKYLTDLIGCRIMLVYKKDWELVNEYLTKIFKNDASCYIDENRYVESYDIITKPLFMAERPVANIRLGDKEIYPADLFKIERDRYYRSLHYIVRYEEYYMEIQVRTIFEEAWGEVDHNVLYPYYKDNSMLVEYSRLINRASGMCDEMSAFFKDILAPMQPRQSGFPMDVPYTTTKASSASIEAFTPPGSQTVAYPQTASSKDMLDIIIFNK